MKTIKTIEQTCDFCPSQWEGYTTDNTPFYIRYRWGYLSVRLGKELGCIDDAINGEEVFGEQLDDEWNGVMSTEEMLVTIQDVLHYV